MKYFDEMDSKFGFGDGDAIPQEAEACRQVYVRVLNPLLKKHNSALRILPYDRGGCHNSIMWVRVPVACFDKVSAKDSRWWENGSCLDDEDFPTVLGQVEGSDDGWDAAVEAANDLNLDDFVEVKVNVLESEVDDLLKEIS